MKKITILAAILSIFIFLIAQSDYENWKSQQEENWKQFKSAEDKAFYEYLEQEWKSFQAFKAEVMDTVPKPEIPPEAKPLKPEKYPEKNIIEKIEIPKEKKTIKPKKISHKYAKNKVEITFWGLPLEFSYQKPNLALSEIDEKAIADFWYKMSNSDYEQLLSDVKDYRNKLHLNDWGYCLLLNEVGKEISDNSKNLTKLFVWFALTKSGYKAKVGFDKNQVYLLIPSQEMIYGNSYLKFEDKRYYIVSFDKRVRKAFSINTYEGNYPNANDLINLSVDNMPNFGDAVVEKDLKFRYDGEDYTIHLKYDKNTAEFFRNYPQTKLDVYFEAPLSVFARKSLANEFKPILEGKPEPEAVNILLRFVQTAFEYKTDREQFGREKTFFGDETLFYPFCDCEDRSVLFSLLVRDLLGLKVIALDYPGHVATAVRFHTNLEGDYIVFQNEKYIVCDPTYINADIGMAIPQFKNVKPKIIALNKLEG